LVYEEAIMETVTEHPSGSL